MKTTILSLCMAFAIALNAQFIPQPMGYNPDSNSDGAIGVQDLMGVLSLYGTEFDNGDSLVVTTWIFPDDYDEGFVEWDEWGTAVIQLPEESDFMYITQTEPYQDVSFFLPEGIGFKVLQVFLTAPEDIQFFARFYNNVAIETEMFGGMFQVFGQTPLSFTFIRGHNGVWYQPAGKVN